MKILQLGKFYPIKGGVEKVMIELLQGLSERQIYCDMLCASDSNSSADHVVTVSEYSRIFCCKTHTKKAATMISSSMVTTLRRICAEYDIIQIHHPDPMACIALFFSGYKGKVVLHWHSDILKQKILLKFYKPFQSWLIRRADVIVGTSPVYVMNSPELKDVQHKTTFFPIGIDHIEPDQNKVERLKSKFDGRKIVFSMGRLVEYKGFEYLIESAKTLSDDYVILIGGEGPLKSKLRKLIDDNNIGDKVKLIGYIPNDELADYFGASDVFCLSSVQKTEAFGIVQIEAMSCGVPVVATNIEGSGVSWVNKDRFSGINVEPRNSSLLASAIDSICKDKNVYSEYSARAKERFDNNFTKQYMISECVRVYEDLFTDKTSTVKNENR